MEADSHSIIGDTHINDNMPCQDYVRSLVLPGAAFAIASDGCSDGGQTDNGSRIIAHATAQSLRQHWTTVGDPFAPGTVPQIALEQRITMNSARATLGLEHSDMLATSLYAYYTPGGGIAHIQGDGVIAWVTKDRSLVMDRFDWLPSGDRPPAPFYPAYYEDNCESFARYYGGDLNGTFLRSETWVRSAGSTEFSQEAATEYTLSEGIRGPVLRLPPDLLYVGVFTDGVMQVEHIDWKDVVEQLLAFKTTTGAFATRRMNRFNKEARRLGHGPLDDLSYAVIRTDDETEEA